jgi:DNA transformation protein
VAISKQYLDYLLGQLAGLGGMTSRRMFGGLGLYSGGTFFGLVYKERLYFRTDDSTRPEYEARGSEGFQPRANVKNAQMTYYTVPAEVLEDEDELVRWARKAVTAAVAKELAKTTAKKPAQKPAKAPAVKPARKPAKGVR